MSWSLSILNDFIVVLQFSPVHWIVWDVNLCACVLRSLFFLSTNCIETRHGCTAGQLWPSLTLKAEEKVFSCDTTQSKTMGNLDETWRKRVKVLMQANCKTLWVVHVFLYLLLLEVAKSFYPTMIFSDNDSGKTIAVSKDEFGGIRCLPLNSTLWRTSMKQEMPHVSSLKSSARDASPC